MELTTQRASLQWFTDAKFGLFVHWGPYSLRGLEASWPLQPHSQQHTPVNEYEALADEFNPIRYDPEAWVRMAKDAGAGYMVLTCKHHDGYCLFSTKTTTYSAPNTGPRRDLVAPFADAARQAGLKVGFYFSLIDWYDPDFATIPIADFIRSPRPFQYDPVRWYAFYRRFVTQIQELLTDYGSVDIMWFDVPGFAAERWCSQELKTMMRSLQPRLLVNDRLPGAGDYGTPEQFIPTVPPDGVWETCMTMNNQWAYHPDGSQYKSVGQLIRNLATVVGKGGNFLLNVGPKPDGTWPEEAEERLAGLGEWMRQNGAAIYGTSRGPHPACFGGPITRKGATLYLHVFNVPPFPLELRGVYGEVAGVRVLHSGELLTYRYYGGVRRPDKLEIDLPQASADPWDTVVAVEFAEPPTCIEW